ncbi:hypothetical protein [Streptosporangium canum]|uniref:hypothetical protein n=1 Tax=Streptosporangium canum TaxID=324952 RepID=UPI00379BBA3E
MTTEETPALVTPPLSPGPEVGLREARTRLGELADRRHLDDRVAELMRADARHPGYGPALDWAGWVQRIERLAGR